MKKIAAMLLGLTMTLGLLAGCAGTKAPENTPAAETAAGSTGTQETAQLDLISQGVLTVGVEAAYPPFEYYAEDGTTIIGFDADVAAAIRRTQVDALSPLEALNLLYELKSRLG